MDYAVNTYVMHIFNLQPYHSRHPVWACIFRVCTFTGCLTVFVPVSIMFPIGMVLDNHYCIYHELKYKYIYLGSCCILTIDVHKSQIL